MYFEVDDEDTECETKRDTVTVPPNCASRGYNKEERGNQPPVVVGLALTRDGLPSLPGVSRQYGRRDDSRPGEGKPAGAGNSGVLFSLVTPGWTLGRISRRLAQGLSHYILAMPVGKLTEVRGVLGRPGRFRPVHASLEVKEVVVGEGAERRYIVCRNVLEAARQRQHREEVLAALRQELARLDPQAPDHAKRACGLVASKHYGRYLSRGPGPAGY